MADNSDRVRALERRVEELFRALSYTDVRRAVITPLGAYEAVAAGLITTGATASVGGGIVRNLTGRPIWQGSTCVIDGGREFIVDTNASRILWGEWDGSSPKDEVASYTWAQSDGDHFDDTDLDDAHFSVLDPGGVLDDVTTDDPDVCFATGGDGAGMNTLTAISVKASAGAPGLPWTGFPTTPDPTTGTTTVVLFKALVNETAGVASSDGTFDFDGGSAQVGTHASSGTCVNVRGAAFVDNEPIEIIKSAAGTFYALKIGGNRVIAQVDGTIATLDNITALEGPAPHADQRIGEALTGQTWADNEWGEFWLQDDGNWSGVKLAPMARMLRGLTAGAVLSSDADMELDNLVAIQGPLPASPLTVDNTFDWELDDNAPVVVVEDSGGLWIPIQAKCPA